ncbi:MAG: hypothetical protein ACLUPK_01810 [Veillonella sp.]
MVHKSRIAVSSESHQQLLSLVGLQGAGMTTTAGKLAVCLRKQGKRPMLMAAERISPSCRPLKLLVVCR